MLIDKALKIQPKNIKAISVKINILEEKGQFVEASKLKEKNKKELELYSKRDVYQSSNLKSSLNIQYKTINSEDIGSVSINKLVQSTNIKTKSFIHSDTVLLGGGGFGEVYRNNLTIELSAQLNVLKNLTKQKLK